MVTAKEIAGPLALSGLRATPVMQGLDGAIGVLLLGDEEPGE